ncbi:DUF4179 domain-containing protein [Solibacillus sp. FSL W8-0474]|uniref:DUF4179 domain-containing protein n=1 Tax=Solibacillus sp. FSL W8-0474 TaxID=2975336 RepID=UPI0030FC62A6
MKIDDSMKKEIQEEMETIQAPSSLYTFAKNIKEESEMKVDFVNTKERKRGWRKFQFAVAAVISLSVLTASAFLNPTMAEMVSKIPYVGQVFQKPIQIVITEVLEKEGYNTAGVGMSRWEDMTLFDIQLKGTEEYVNQEEDNVLAILSGVLEKRGYDNYELTISETNEISPVLAEIFNQRAEIGEKLKSELQVAGYTILDVNAYSPIIKVYIPVTDEAKKAEINTVANEFLESNGSLKSVHIITKDVSFEELETKWMPVITSIEEELYLRKEYRVDDIRYTFKPEKVSITIKLNMNTSHTEAKEAVNKIHERITEFLNSEEVKIKTDNQGYELIIQDKNGKDFQF